MALLNFIAGVFANRVCPWFGRLCTEFGKYKETYDDFHCKGDEKYYMDYYK